MNKIEDEGGTMREENAGLVSVRGKLNEEDGVEENATKIGGRANRTRTGGTAQRSQICAPIQIMRPQPTGPS